MDTQILKSEVQRVIDALIAEGRTFDFVALVPAYPGDINTSYIIQIGADWMTMRNFHETLPIVSRKIFELLDKNIIRYINRVGLYEKNGDIQCLDEDLILINKINYKPDLWRLVQAQ